MWLAKGKNSKQKERASLVQTNKRDPQPKYNLREKPIKKVAHPYYSLRGKLNDIPVF